jgi:hypothetical protein
LGCQKLFIAISTYKKGCCVRDLHKRNSLKFDDVHTKCHKEQRIYVRNAGVARAYSGEGRKEGQKPTSHYYGLKTPKINKSHSERIQCYEIITIYFLPLLNGYFGHVPLG